MRSFFYLALIPLEITVLTFAHARDAFGFSTRAVHCEPQDTPRAIIRRLAPEVELAHFRVAVDCEYAGWDSPIHEARELAIIPPVSGG